MWLSVLEQKRMTDMSTRGRDSPESSSRIVCFSARILYCLCHVWMGGWRRSHVGCKTGVAACIALASSRNGIIAIPPTHASIESRTLTSGFSRSRMISSCCTADAFSVWKSTVQLVSMDDTGGGAAGAMLACFLLLLPPLIRLGNDDQNANTNSNKRRFPLGGCCLMGQRSREEGAYLFGFV